MWRCMTFSINFIITLFNNKFFFEILSGEGYLFCHYSCIYMFSAYGYVFPSACILFKLIIIKMSCHHSYKIIQVSSYTLPPGICLITLFLHCNANIISAFETCFSPITNAEQPLPVPLSSCCQCAGVKMFFWHKYTLLFHNKIKRYFLQIFLYYIITHKIKHIVLYEIK